MFLADPIGERIISRRCIINHWTLHYYHHLTYPLKSYCVATTTIKSHSLSQSMWMHMIAASVSFASDSYDPLTTPVNLRSQGWFCSSPPFSSQAPSLPPLLSLVLLFFFLPPRQTNLPLVRSSVAGEDDDGGRGESWGELGERGEEEGCTGGDWYIRERGR